MRCKGCFAAWAAMVLLLAASGCGLEGPVPGDKKAADGNPGSSVPASAAASYNNMKQIGIAMQNYASTYTNAFPPAAAVVNGKPYCSWRVRILPFMEEDALYRQYHINEPWDSPNNLEVAKKMPKVYQTPGRPDDGRTCFLAFAGKDTALGDPKNAKANVPLASLSDGTSNTILVVEAGPEKAVPWTKPEDLPFDPLNPLAALGQIPEEGFLAAMGDGSVHRFKVDNATLKALITPAGNERIDMKRITGEQ